LANADIKSPSEH